MSFKKTEAIVIKTLNLREADKIVTFFSRDYGKIQGIARGARKIRAKQGGNFELFTRLNDVATAAIGKNYQGIVAGLLSLATIIYFWITGNKQTSQK